MERRFMRTAEVAEMMCVSRKTLLNMACKHAVYKASRRGIYHVEQVRVIEKVWAGLLSEDEGLSDLRVRLKGLY
jgi:hypothetical protein